MFEQPPPNFMNTIYSDDIREWMTLLLNRNPDERSNYAEIMKHSYIAMQKRLLAGAFIKKSLTSWANQVIDAL